MKPPPFDYVAPATLDAALAALAAHGADGKVLAGGQSLVPMLNLRLLHPDTLIDINGVPGLDRIEVADGQLCIGALARHRALHDSHVVAEACPLMAEAYQHVAHGPIRNRGTLGGNLSHADPASEMPAVALALDATLVVRSSRGSREIAAQEFFLGPLSTALADDELLVEVRMPVSPVAQGWSFQEVSQRKGDFAFVATGALLRVADGVCEAATLVFAGLSDRPRRAPKAEQLLIGEPPGEALFRRAGEAAADEIEPTSDQHADAAYRRDLARVLVRRTLTQAHARCDSRGGR